MNEFSLLFFDDFFFPMIDLEFVVSRVQLQKVLSSGFDDGSWPLQTKTGR